MRGFFIAIGAFVALFALMFFVSFNNMVDYNEKVSQTWAQVQNVYQRRFDLVPNLVTTVKAYAAHEKEVFENVADARARLGQVNVGNLASADPAMQQKFLDAQQQLGGALSRLLAISENYPELKASENFLALQNELAGTENRIAVERKRNQEAIQIYNSYVRRFPNVIVARITGFAPHDYFAADEGAGRAPQVKF